MYLYEGYVYTLRPLSVMLFHVFHKKKEHLIVQRGTIDTQVMVRGRNRLSYELINTVHISIRFQLFRYTDLW